MPWLETDPMNERKRFILKATGGHKYFVREGLVKKPRRSRRRPHPGRPTAPFDAPNAIWSADFKGQFKTLDGRYCYPLTVQDGFSRYLLACQGLEGTTYSASRRVFTRLFREFGLPQRTERPSRTHAQRPQGRGHHPACRKPFRPAEALQLLPYRLQRYPTSRSPRPEAACSVQNTSVSKRSTTTSGPSTLAPSRSPGCTQEKVPSSTTMAPLLVTQNCNPSRFSFCYPSGFGLIALWSVLHMIQPLEIRILRPKRSFVAER